MSVLVSAIIAGATAGLTKVGSEIIGDLYGTLKKKIAEVEPIDLKEVESDPASPIARSKLEDIFSENGIYSVESVKSIANEIVELAITEGIVADNQWLVEVERLKARGEIRFSNVETDRLLKARIVETEGGFTVENIGKTEKSTTSESSIQVGSLTAGVVNFVRTTVKDMPGWVKFTLLATLALLLFYVVSDYLGKRAKFDAAVHQMLERSGTDFMSSVNSMSNLDGVVRNTRDTGFWSELNRVLNTHVNRLEGLLTPLAYGLGSNEMVATEAADRICPGLKSSLRAFYKTVADAEQVTGIGLNFIAGSSSPEVAVFGPVLNVPGTGLMESFYTSACGNDLAAIKNPPDIRTPQQRRDDKVKGIDEQLAELTELKSLDVDALAAEARAEFVYTIASYYIRMQMWPADARAKAEGEYLEALSGMGMHYEIPGGNDAVDRIRSVQRLRSRDVDAEIAALQEERAEVLAAPL